MVEPVCGRELRACLEIIYELSENSPPAQRAGRPQPRAEAEGRCPGKKGTPSLRPEGPREPARLILFAPTEALSDVVGHLKKSSNDWLRNRGPQTPGQLSRGLSGRTALSISPPRASACGLSPGLRSPGPLGRTGRPLAACFVGGRAPASHSGLSIDQPTDPTAGRPSGYFVTGPNQGRLVPTAPQATPQRPSAPRRRNG
jgi:hypothetical protein